MISPNPASIARSGLVLILVLAGLPLCAQMDLSGDWGIRMHEDQPWRGPGPELGEYEGLPLSLAGRLKALAWNASLNTLPERQCNPLPADDFTDFGNMRIWREVDPVTQKVIAWHEYTEWQAQERVIWMDGRPHPSDYAPHTWQGFSTGKWEGNQLTIFTDHLKMAPYERVGLYRSDKGTLLEHWVRHGNYLTIMLVISDPVFLAEPLVRTRNYELSLNMQMHGYSCTPTAEIANRAEGYVPHYLPGKNPFMLSATKRFGVPEAAVGGGPETMYPEFERVLANPATAHVLPPETPPASNGAAQVDKPESADLTVLPVQGGVYLLASDRGNTVVQVGEYSVLVVDTQVAEMAGKILDAIKQISSKPIRYIINTSADPDHTGGNAEIAKAGNSVGGQYAQFIGEQTASAAAIIAHENVLKRMSAPSGVKNPIPFEAWPTETFITPEYQMFNGEGIRVIHEPAAHSDGDSMVFFRRSDVISTGDVFSTITYPVIDQQRGGSINGIIAALNNIIKVTIPREKEEGGTYVVPGYGRICDQADVVEYRDMVTIIRDRIADLIKEGKTLNQVLAARPTLDYDPRYGAPTASWTKEKFIEAIYADLSRPKGK